MAQLIPNATAVRGSKNIVDDVSGRIDITYVYDTRDELSLGMNIEEINSTLLLRKRKRY